MFIGKPVILLVDELVKIRRTNNDRAMEVLSTIELVLDRVEQFFSFVTTLDLVPVVQEGKGSGRKTKWVYLSTLDPFSARALINSCRQPIKTSEGKVFRMTDLQCVSMVTADCAGHPRSLECVARVLMAKTSTTIGTMLSSSGEPSFLLTLYHDVKCLLKLK
ncbi:hypothetical protein QOT17_008601 [Balamuthia mandrillaris]